VCYTRRANNSNTTAINDESTTIEDSLPEVVVEVVGK